ncbi:hypothetical protein [Sphingobium amiense]|uniref:hypothetical protein n=1 Tax=Sphingobium amiense TaxID=135719 RepID=UPI000F841E23|nr:hypothetical protein [Sphingobium amiense]
MVEDALRYYSMKNASSKRSDSDGFETSYHRQAPVLGEAIPYLMSVDQEFLDIGQKARQASSHLVRSSSVLLPFLLLGDNTLDRRLNERLLRSIAFEKSWVR